MNARRAITLATSDASSFFWMQVDVRSSSSFSASARLWTFDFLSDMNSPLNIWRYGKCIFPTVHPGVRPVSLELLLNFTRMDICGCDHSFHLVLQLELTGTTAWWMEMSKLLHSFWSKLDISAQNYTLLLSFYLSERQTALLMKGFP